MSAAFRDATDLISSFLLLTRLRCPPIRRPHPHIERPSCRPSHTELPRAPSLTRTLGLLSDVFLQVTVSFAFRFAMIYPRVLYTARTHMGRTSCPVYVRDFFSSELITRAHRHPLLVAPRVSQ